MTVAELIKKLSYLQQDLRVFFKMKNEAYHLKACEEDPVELLKCNIGEVVSINIEFLLDSDAGAEELLSAVPPEEWDERQEHVYQDSDDRFTDQPQMMTIRPTNCDCDGHFDRQALANEADPNYR